MKIIVGLGNPGKEYENTRHNAGYLFIDALASNKELASVDENSELKTDKKFKASVAKIKHKGEDIILVKPETFMNSSGQAVQAILSFYKAETKDLIVASDDIDLPIGVVRVRNEGGSAGQKGLQNIIDSVGNDKFVRFRIGISGDRENKNTEETAEYVLSQFSKREKPLIDNSIKEATAYLLTYLGQKEQIPSHTLEVEFDTQK
jgi:PTH1 family peptidyl-tRNA hydrolase